jgi:metal-sulfur cluster biosynthetic enzyme
MAHDAPVDAADRPPSQVADGSRRADVAERRHGAVADAARRTHHVVASPSGGMRDARYASDDLALDALWLALHEVSDPELPVSLVDLGLVYAVRRGADVVEVDLTFTATACPCMAFIHEDVRTRLLREPGVRAVEIRDVWDPPWTAERMTAAGKTMLRESGVAA